MNFKTAFAVSALAFGLAQATVNYPFPQQSTYDGRGTVLSDQASASTQLASAFSYYLSTFYNEQGTYAAIRSNDGSNEYFSEGMGYGMLMMVYFSNETTSYQDQFDKLWNFYQYSMNSNGLMNWKMGNISSSGADIWGEGAATDAEMDVAAALIMAAYQFGDNSYLTYAKTLIQNMKAYEFTSSGAELPGDSWGDTQNQLNPSYFAPGYFELFAIVDSDNATFWSETAMDVNYSYSEASANEVSTYLVDDWVYTKSNSDPTFSYSQDDTYNYDAPRFPWRMAMAYYWYNHSRAYTLNYNLGSWVNGISAANVKGPITRSTGSMNSDQNSTFVASLMTALGSNAAYQSQLDAYWAQAVSFGNENYFNQSLKILCGLAVSGNMPNLYALANGVVIEGDASDPISKTAIKNAKLSFSVESRVLHLSLPEASRVDLIDLGGRVVKTLASNASGNVSLSLEGVPSGVYMARVKGQTLNAAQRIAVK